MHDRTLPDDVPRKRVQYTWDTQDDCEDDREVLKRRTLPVTFIVHIFKPASHFRPLNSRLLQKSIRKAIVAHRIYQFSVISCWEANFTYYLPKYYNINLIRI